MRRLFLSGLLALLPLTAMAADKPKGKEGPPIDFDTRLSHSNKAQDMARVQEVFGAYMDICLGVFPDMDALPNHLARKGYKPLSPEAVGARIGGKPGRGWVLGDPDATDRLELVVQDEPRQSCSLWAFDGHAGNYDMMGQMMISALGAKPNLDIQVFETPQNSQFPTQYRRGYIMKLLKDGQEVEGAGASMLIIIVDNDPKAAFRVRYARVIQ